MSSARGVGTSNRHGAKSVTQLELLAKPGDPEHNPVWPYWPTRLRTSSSHEEGVERDWAVSTKAFVGEGGKVKFSYPSTYMNTLRGNWGCAATGATHLYGPASMSAAAPPCSSGMTSGRR